MPPPESRPEQQKEMFEIQTPLVKKVIPLGLATTQAKVRFALLRLSLGVLGIESASVACSVIDFASQCCRIASLVFHCVGSAITNKVFVLRTQQK